MKNSFTPMRKLLLAGTVAACALAVPAQARDGEVYAGIDAGLAMPKDTKIDVNTFNNAIVVDNGNGFSGDALIGYDWGALRTEAELGYQQWGLNTLTVTAPGVPVVNPLGVTYPTGTFNDADGKTHVMTLMANALLDF